MTRQRIGYTVLALCLAGIGAVVRYAHAEGDAQTEDDVQTRISAISARLASIEDRSMRVVAINDIENLQRTYGYYLDKMLWEHVLDLLTEDATLEIGSSGVYRGKQRIREYLFALSDGKEGPLDGVLYNHMQLQPVITLAADQRSANGRWHTLILTGESGSGSGGNWGEAIYENEYRKEGDVWRISRLHSFVRFMAPYEGGWLNPDPEAIRVYSERPGVPPDGPPTGEYAPFPATFIPPVHFSHPVSGE